MLNRTSFGSFGRNFALVTGESGSALIMVMVAAALGTIVAFGTATMLANLQKSVNNVGFRSGADVLSDEMRAGLGSDKACLNTFNGLVVDPNAPASSYNITTIRDGSAAPGNILYQAGERYGDGSVKVESMSLTGYTPGSTPATASMTLVLNLQTGRESMGAQVVARTINLNIRTNAGNAISSCIAAAKMSDGIWQRTIANLDNISFVGPVTGGNVGIGTTTPSVALEIQNPGGANGSLRLLDGGDMDFTALDPNRGLIFNRSPAGYIRQDMVGGKLEIMTSLVATNDTTAMTFLPSGDIGIGTSAPSSRLEVHDDSGVSSGFHLLTRQIRTIGRNSGIATGYWADGATDVAGVLRTAGEDTDLILATFPGGALAERIRIKNDGNVGIGTTDPLSKLTVMGKVAVNNTALGSNSLDVYTAAPGVIAAFQSNSSNLTSGWSLIGITGLSSPSTQVIEGLRASISSTDRADIAIYQYGPGNARFHALAIGSGNAQSTYDAVGAPGDEFVWSVGMDQSDNHKFKIARSPNLGTQTWLTITTDGKAGMGTSAPSYRLDVAGDVNTSTCYRAGGAQVAGTCPSDLRLKKDIRHFDLGLPEILRMQPQIYRFNGLGGLQKDIEEVGLIAQEIEPVAPSLVERRELKLHADDRELTELKAVNYSRILFVVINAIKEFYVEFSSTRDELKARISALERDNENLRGSNEELQKWACGRDPSAPFCK
jgi:hypothetical protein